MTAPLHRHVRFGLILTIAGFVALSPGCSSDAPDRRAEGPPHPRKPAPPLVGKEIFFNGQITAELNVGAGQGFEGRAAKENDGSPGEHMSHGGGMLLGGGGGGRHYGGDRDFGGQETDPSAQAEREHMQAMRHSAANTNPPVMIHLRFTNKGNTRADLLIADFLSPLGNFVVEPDHLALEPGQTLEVEPMTSRLAGEISGTTVTLALRLAGQGEKKDVALSLASEAAPEPPPAEPPAGTK